MLLLSLLHSQHARLRRLSRHLRRLQRTRQTIRMSVRGRMAIPVSDGRWGGSVARPSPSPCQQRLGCETKCRHRLVVIDVYQWWHFASQFRSSVSHMARRFPNHPRKGLVEVPGFEPGSATTSISLHRAILHNLFNAASAGA